MQFTRKAATKGALVAVGFLGATAIVTGLVPTPVFHRYVPRSGFDVLFLLLTTVLLGVYATQRCTRVDCARSVPAYLGGLGGVFAVSCPYCFPGILSVVGAPAVAAYLVPVRPVVGVTSVAVLVGVITVRQRRLVTEGPASSDVDLRCPTCGTVLKREVDEPDPEFTAGRMRVDLDCPHCTESLVVFVEAASGDGIDIRKRVERGTDPSGDGPNLNPYSLAPGDESDDW